VTQYKNSFIHFLEWINNSNNSEWQSLLIDDEVNTVWRRINVPLPKNVMLAFLRHQGHDEEDNPLSKSSVNSGRSMFKYLHKKLTKIVLMLIMILKPRIS
jgi:hypothetical protein